MRDEHQTSLEASMYRILFESHADPIVVIDDVCHIVAANRAAKASSELAQIISTDGPDPALLPMIAELRANGHARAEMRVVNRSGDARVFELRSQSIAAERYAILFRDVSQERQLEAEVAQLRRVESLGFLTASVVHDFNNMLTPMLCLSGVLANALEPGSRLARLALEVQSAAERATGLVRQLLAFAARTPDNASQLDVTGVLSELRPLLERAIGEDVELSLVLDNTSGAANVDRDQLEQVVMNLTVNARDAMPRGGHLTIRAKPVTLSKDDGRAHGWKIMGEHIAISVTDTGVGMAAEVKARMFERFFSTKGGERSSGLGLGLATAQRFVTRNHGGIDVYSEPGLGTTITLYLPRVADVAPSSSERAARSPRGTETIVVIDDDDGVRDVAHIVLAELGYRVFCAASAGEALELLRGENAHVDLVLTDVVMPTMSGKDLVDTLIRDGIRTKVLFMSGYTEAVVRDHGVVPSKAFLRKAFSPSELARTVRRVLDS